MLDYVSTAAAACIQKLLQLLQHIGVDHRAAYFRNNISSTTLFGLEPSWLWRCNTSNWKKIYKALLDETGWSELETTRAFHALWGISRANCIQFWRQASDICGVGSDDVKIDDVQIVWMRTTSQGPNQKWPQKADYGGRSRTVHTVGEPTVVRTRLRLMRNRRDLYTPRMEKLRAKYKTMVLKRDKHLRLTRRTC